jgi:hypothetical protein
MVRFDPVIYPLKLWVAISDDGKDLNGLFRHHETGELMRFEEYDIDSKEALVFPVSEADSGRRGVLIIFRNRMYMTCKTIAHEAVHAAGFMFEQIGQEIDSEEPVAYLVGWIAEWCWGMRTNKKNDRKA